MSNVDDIIRAFEDLPGATVSGNRVTIRPSKSGDGSVRLRANKNGKGYVTSYTLSIGSAEAAQAGFLDENKCPLPLEKTVDPEAHTITFRLK